MAGINCPVPSSSPCAGYADGAFAVGFRKERRAVVIDCLKMLEKHIEYPVVYLLFFVDLQFWGF